MLSSRLLLIFLMGGFCHSIQAQQISDTKFGKGMLNFIAKDSSFSVKFAPRMQSRFESKCFASD